MEIELSGGAAFNFKVDVMLGQLAQGPGGAGFVRELRESDHTVTFVPTTGDNRTIFDSGPNSQNGVGTGATVYFNTSQERGNWDETGKAERPAFVGLGHEAVGHVLAGMRGEAPADHYDAEADAISRENVVRQEHDLPRAVPPTAPPEAPLEEEPK